MYKVLRPLFKGVIIGNGRLTPDTANQAIENGDFDAASFATLYVTNPDLVERFKNNWPLHENPD